jgi:outer membrane protein
MAIESHPAMGVARASEEQAGHAVGVARAGWFPDLSVTANATQYEEPVPVTPIHGFTPGLAPPFDETLVIYSLNLEYTLFDGGARFADVRGAGAQHDAARATREGREQEIIAATVQAYLRVLSAREILAAHDQRVGALEAERARVDRFFQEERAARVEVLRAEAALSAAEADRVRAKAGLQVATQELSRTIGAEEGALEIGGLVGVGLAGELPEEAPPAAADLLPAALAENPSVRAARYTHETAQAGVSLAKSARWPRLLLAGSLFDQGDLSGNRVNEWKAGAMLTFPLFTGGETWKRVAEARAAEKAAGESVRMAEYDLERELDRAVAGFEEARARVESLERSVEASEEVAKIEKLMLDAGSGTQTDYLDAEATLVTARANLVEARHGEIMARAEIARVAGELDTEWIATHLENLP